MSLNEDFNLRRLERYLTLARESGAQPVDPPHEDRPLAADVATLRVLEVESIAVRRARPSRSRACPARASSSFARTSAPGVTIALLGSSGVGKSTLVNTLAGEELLATQEIRETTARAGTRRPTGSSSCLPGGGARDRHAGDARAPALGVADEGLEETFEDVDVPLRPVPLLRLRPRQRAGLRGEGGARGRDARPRALGELPQAAARSSRTSSGGSTSAQRPRSESAGRRSRASPATRRGRRAEE